MKTITVAIAATVIALTAGAALAQQKGSGVSIGGNVNQNTNVQGAVTTVNTGKSGCASTSIGSISSNPGC